MANFAAHCAAPSVPHVLKDLKAEEKQRVGGSPAPHSLPSPPCSPGSPLPPISPAPLPLHPLPLALLFSAHLLCFLLFSMSSPPLPSPPSRSPPSCPCPLWATPPPSPSSLLPALHEGPSYLDNTALVADVKSNTASLRNHGIPRALKAEPVRQPSVPLPFHLLANARPTWSDCSSATPRNRPPPFISSPSLLQTCNPRLSPFTLSPLPIPSRFRRACFAGYPSRRLSRLQDSDLQLFAGRSGRTHLLPRASARGSRFARLCPFSRISCMSAATWWSHQS